MPTTDGEEICRERVKEFSKDYPEGADFDVLQRYNFILSEGEVLEKEFLACQEELNLVLSNTIDYKSST